MRTPSYRTLTALLALGLSLASAPASAADLGAADEAAVETAAAPTWGGLYLGAHAGDSFNHGSLSALDYGISVSDSGNIAVAGLYGGYSLQMGRVIVGAEVDWTAEINGDSSNLFTVRGRIGFDLGRAMIYGTAGWGRESFAVPNSTPGQSALEKTMSGLVVGGGVEAWLTPRLSLRGEYLFFSPSDLDMNFADVYPSGTGTLRVDYDRSIVRAGLTYHFN